MFERWRYNLPSGNCFDLVRGSNPGQGSSITNQRRPRLPSRLTLRTSAMRSIRTPPVCATDLHEVRKGNSAGRPRTHLSAEEVRLRVRMERYPPLFSNKSLTGW
jgi:hypothetical protein